MRRLILVLLLLLPGRAWADQPDYAADGLPVPSIARLFPRNADPFGQRAALAERGVNFNLWYRNDVLANVLGGVRRGTVNQGMLEPAITVDFERLAGISGLRFFANGFILHNTGRIRRDYVGGINTIAAIEGLPSARLSELWLEQSLFQDRLHLRIGQLAADVEFFFAPIAALFLQSDWATISALNLPSGGPAYPLATPGAMLRFTPAPNRIWQFAILNGDPAGPGLGDEQRRNRDGLAFRLRDPALMLAEMHLTWNRGSGDAGLAGRLKLGGWGHLGRFDHQRIADDGRLLADPLGSGRARRLRGQWGVYAVGEQQVLRLSDDRHVTAFGRISVAPPERSLIGFFADAGMVAHGLVPGRPADSFGFSIMWAQFSGAARAFDRDRNRLTGVAGVVRDAEVNLEVTYSAEVRPGFNLQPVLTHVWGPAGDRRRHAMVMGLRTALRF